MSGKKAPTLTAKAARCLLDAETAVALCRAELQKAEQRRNGLRDRYREQIPPSKDPDEQAKGIRTITAGKVRVRVTPASTGDRFSLTKYRAAGHEVTKEMRDGITPGEPYDRWTVAPLEEADG